MQRTLLMFHECAAFERTFSFNEKASCTKFSIVSYLKDVFIINNNSNKDDMKQINITKVITILKAPHTIEKMLLIKKKETQST